MLGARMCPSLHPVNLIHMKPLRLELVDAQAQALKHPNTFEAPSLNEIAQLHAEDFVKVCIHEPGETGERFWCKIKSINHRTQTITGTIDNILVIYNYKLGTPVEIKFSEVFSFIDRN